MHLGIEARYIINLRDSVFLGRYRSFSAQHRWQWCDTGNGQIAIYFDPF